jgi:hypothetical protein
LRFLNKAPFECGTDLPPLVPACILSSAELDRRPAYEAKSVPRPYEDYLEAFAKRRHHPILLHRAKCSWAVLPKRDTNAAMPEAEDTYREFLKVIGTPRAEGRGDRLRALKPQVGSVQQWRTAIEMKRRKLDEALTRTESLEAHRRSSRSELAPSCTSWGNG